MTEYDPPEGSGEWLAINPKVIAGSIKEHVRHIKEHFGDHHPLETSLPIGEADEPVVLSPDGVEVEETEESGKFTVRLKDEVVGHPGRTTAIVTGAAILTAAAIHYANTKKKK